MYENETFPLHLQGCYDKAIEYIKQHSLYITLACAIVPILLVSRALTVPGITKSKDGRAYLRAVFSVNANTYFSFLSKCPCWWSHFCSPYYKLLKNILCIKCKTLQYITSRHTTLNKLWSNVDFLCWININFMLDFENLFQRWSLNVESTLIINVDYMLKNCRFNIYSLILFWKRRGGS